MFSVCCCDWGNSMGLFSNHEPIIMKEGSSAHDELAAIESLRGSLPAKTQAELDAYERSVKAGVAGEDRILYELKNSHMDMVVLQDLFLEHNGLTAQIDFMVFTRQRYFAIECKNLYGNIQVDAQGNFIRYLGGGRREGMYSPITQNRRHLELIRAIRRDNHGVAFNLIADRTFDDQFRSLVVLANPKTVLNDRYAPEDVKAQIIRADQLIATIESINEQPGVGHSKMSLSDIRKAGGGPAFPECRKPGRLRGKVSQDGRRARQGAGRSAARCSARGSTDRAGRVPPLRFALGAAHRQTRRAGGQKVLRLQLLPALPLHKERRLAVCYNVLQPLGGRYG